jgi:hypothetical protein
LSRFNASGNPLILLIEREILEDCCEFEDISVWVFEQRTGAARLEGRLRPETWKVEERNRKLRGSSNA